MSKPKEVQNLILMLSSGVFVAFLVIAALLYFYGSSGTYLVRSILISPDALEHISFGSEEGSSRFVFNKIEFVRAESLGKGWGRYAVSKQSYAAFYKLIAGERSLPHLSDEMIRGFETVAPSTLTIFVQPRDTGKNDALFQEVEFLDREDVFRIKMRDEEETWVYFRYPEIYNRAIELFAP
ncbi:MAG: hypothetical protein S4CHLAM2_16920 [Chlamydiales bacterium]|nr:hypothetical protein [Chlamydiales bacterium]